MKPLLGGWAPTSDTGLISMVIVSPLSRDVGPLPNGLSMAYKWGLLTTYKSWDDPPSVENSEKVQRFLKNCPLLINQPPRATYHPPRNKAYMGVSKNNGTPKSSILIGFSIVFTNHFGFFPYFWKHPYDQGLLTPLVSLNDSPAIDLT